ncbi:MAG: hypothetical protein LBP62_05500 [Clostridiales bacterium]|nr:hypothetical protein [Clostridiales bacterium]
MFSSPNRSPHPFNPLPRRGISAKRAFGYRIYCFHKYSHLNGGEFPLNTLSDIESIAFTNILILMEIR